MMSNTKTSGLLYALIVMFIVGGVSRGQFDPARHIALDEIRTDMAAYALTVWYGTEVEKFPLKVLSVVRNRQPGNDMILVVGTDERFMHAGGVRGCSGSPVFLDGRLAGALAAGWSGASRSPICWRA